MHTLVIPKVKLIKLYFNPNYLIWIKLMIHPLPTILVRVTGGRSLSQLSWEARYTLDRSPVNQATIRTYGQFGVTN